MPSPTHNTNGAPQTPTDGGAPRSTPETPPKHEHAFGPAIGIAVIVALLLLGGFYVWNTQVAEAPENGDEKAAEDIRSQDDPVVEDLESTSSSDDVNSIESDLEATSFSELDADLENIDQESAQ